MDAPTTKRAIASGIDVAIRLGHAVDDSGILQNSNRVTARLEPAGVIARIAPAAKRLVAEREVDIVHRLERLGAPVTPLDPRSGPTVHDTGEFVVTLWSACRATTPAGVAPDEYADALARLHAGLRAVAGGDVWPVRVADRVHQAREALEAPMSGAMVLEREDLEFVRSALSDTDELIDDANPNHQLLHGEPHRDNLMRTGSGVVFFDFETCCRGPVEFDLAHATEPDGTLTLEVAAHYPGVDLDIVRRCWRTTLALAIAWRCEPGDSLPDGPARAAQWLQALRADRDGE